MDDWDADDFEVPAATETKAPAAWDDEDEDDGVAVPAIAVPSSKPRAEYKDMTKDELLALIAQLEAKIPKESKKKGKTSKKKIQEKEEQDRLERERREAEIAAQEPQLTKEEELATKIALKKEIDQSNLDEVKEFLGEQLEDVVLIEAMQPKTRADFDTFRGAIVNKASKYDMSPHFKHFVEELSRDLVLTMDSESIRGITKALNVVANEKSKTEKGKKKPSKPKKNTLAGGKGAASQLKGFLDDEGGNDDIADEYDFM